MKKVIIRAAISAAVFAVAVAAVRRFAPAIHERAMNKCHQMMGKCQEMLGQQTSGPADRADMSATGSDPEQAAAGTHEPAQATRVS